MTKEDIEILKCACDMLISQIGASINSNEPKDKQKGRDYLKKVLSASEKLDEIKTKD